MPTTTPVDEELDPTELADQDEVHDEEPVIVEDEPAPIDPDAEIVAEIDKVAVAEETPNNKQKAHMIPRHLIDAPLDITKDLFDEGTI